jgi:hypothetical protein
LFPNYRAIYFNHHSEASAFPLLTFFVPGSV